MMVLSSSDTSSTTITTTNRKTRVENNWLFLTTFLLLASILLLLSSSSSFTNRLFDVDVHRLLPSTEEIKQSGGNVILIGSDLITTATDEADDAVVEESSNNRGGNSYFRQSEVLSKKTNNVPTTTGSSIEQSSEVSNKTKKDVSSSSSSSTTTTTGATATPTTSKINNPSSVNNNIFFPREPLPRTWIESSQKRKLPLALLHIPKTGGSSIEEAASNQNLGWGKCAFLNGEHGCNKRSSQHDSNSWNNITFDNAWTQNKVPFWHVPIQSLSSQNIGYNPYKNHDVFAVIRNPYQRAVSAYYFNSRHVFSDGKEKDTIERLNNILQDKLLHVKSNRWYHGGHWIPQYDFIYDDSNDSSNSNNGTTTNITRKRNRMVKHVISFEYLEIEFNSLMESYGLKVTLESSHKANSVTNFIKPMYSAKDLSLKTRKLIEEIYEKDFELGNYNKLL